MWNRRQIVKAGTTMTAAAMMGDRAFAQATGAPVSEKVTVDLRRETGALDHIWSRCAGSDRAA